MLLRVCLFIGQFRLATASAASAALDNYINHQSCIFDVGGGGRRWPKLALMADEDQTQATTSTIHECAGHCLVAMTAMVGWSVAYDQSTAMQHSDVIDRTKFIELIQSETPFAVILYTITRKYCAQPRQMWHSGASLQVRSNRVWSMQ